jgi:hypothetical protein
MLAHAAGQHRREHCSFYLNATAEAANTLLCVEESDKELLSVDSPTGV